MADVKSIRKLADLCIQLVFPLRCPVCDQVVTPFGEKICLGCMKKLKYVTSPRCLKCGKKVEDEGQEYCGDCSRKEHLFVSGRALYEYESVASAIYRFKYGGRQEYADFFGEEIGHYLGDYIRQISPDALIPIPLHRARQRSRGYNQAELLAKSISGYTGFPVYDKILIRTQNTVPLKRLNPRERQNNLKRAFNIRANDVKLNTIILIDDIYTTGSTIDAASAALLSSGAKRIYFIALACGKGV